MNPVPPEILKACDIRGPVPKPLGPAQAECIGLAAGTLLKEEPDRNIKAVVGRDVRVSGESLQRALVKGLRGTGLKVLDAGQVSTPLLAYAARASRASLGIMVTASHNPPGYNGFKFVREGHPVTPSWMGRFYKVLGRETFRKGAGIVERKVFLPDYRNSLVNSVARNFQDRRIVVDAGNGAAALTAPPVLESLGCRVEWMNGRPDGRFPGRGADSSAPEALRRLGERVRKSRAFLGAAFDGDADRVSFTDEKGTEVPAEVILALFARNLPRKGRAPRVVYDGKCSGWLETELGARGGQALLERSGHAFIFERMQKEGVDLGGEASGHFFLPGDFPGDALFTLLKLLELLKKEGTTLGRVMESFPKRVSTHDLKLELPGEGLEGLYGSLKRRAQELGASVSTLDGVRAVFPQGWGIIRASVTEPVVSCRFEAPTAPKLAALIGNWLKEVPEFRDRVMARWGRSRAGRG